VIEIAGQTTKHVHHFGEMAKKKSEAAGAKIGVSMKKSCLLCWYTGNKDQQN